MEDKEAALMRAEMQIVAHEMVLRAIFRILDRQAPAFRPSLVRTASHLVEQEIRNMVFPQARDAVTSDLLAAEYQEAFEALMKRIETGTV